MEKPTEDLPFIMQYLYRLDIKYFMQTLIELMY